MRIILITTASMLVAIVVGLVGLLLGGWSGVVTWALAIFSLIYALAISLLLAGGSDGNDGD